MKYQFFWTRVNFFEIELLICVRNCIRSRAVLWSLQTLSGIPNLRLFSIAWHLMIFSYHPIVSCWWMYMGNLVSLWVLMMSSLSVVVSTAIIFFRPPIWLLPNHLFDSDFHNPCLDQKYLSMRLHSDSYVLIIRSLWILRYPMYVGIEMTIEVSHLLRFFVEKSDGSDVVVYFSHSIAIYFFRCIHCRWGIANYDDDISVFLTGKLSIIFPLLKSLFVFF